MPMVYFFPSVSNFPVCSRDRVVEKQRDATSAPGIGAASSRACTGAYGSGVLTA